MADLINGYPFDSSLFADEGALPLVRIRDIRTTQFETFIPADGIPDEVMIRDGDVVIGMDGDFNVVHWCRGPAVLNQRLCLLRANGGADNRFLSYALPSHLNVINDLTYATTVKHLSSGQVRSIRLNAPDLTEQRTIADFLDRQTAQIDTLIAEQERLIEMLRARRVAESTRHFHSAEGKRLTTVKRTLRPLARPSAPNLGVVTAYRDGQVTLRANRRDDGYTFSNTEHGYQEVRPGDLVFHALDGFAGAVGVSDSHGNATPVYHVCEPAAGDNAQYVALLLRHLGLSGFLATQAPSTRQRSVDFRNWATFGRVPMALPPLDEQRRVVAEIEEQTTKIDGLIGETETFIELAKERRSALITAAVTGQIDVRGEVA